MTNLESKFFFPLDPIPRLSCTDPRALDLIANEKPVVLTDAHLCDAALKWDLNYLEQNIGGGSHVVFSSPTNTFKYYDDVKARQYCPDFIPPTDRLELTFEEFARKIRNWTPGDKRLYLQQGLNSSVGPAVAADFISFNWPWLTSQQKQLGWGALTSNLLLVAMAGNVTPVHYDEQQNFFCQLIGEKHCVLLSPDHHDRLYPHPVYHPHDRQSQVDLLDPDFAKYPGLHQLRGCSTLLQPGEALYVPIYWWHHIASTESQPYTVSVNFWYKGASAEAVSYPLLPRQHVAIMRNVEKMLLDALKYPADVNLLLQSMVLGRYTAPGAALPLELSNSLSARTCNNLTERFNSSGISFNEHVDISALVMGSSSRSDSKRISKNKRDYGDLDENKTPDFFEESGAKLSESTSSEESQEYEDDEDVIQDKYRSSADGAEVSTVNAIQSHS